jgi:polyribonucleotide 5'-hydroxyl-kinase
MAPSSALPIGAARAVSETQAVPIDPAQPGSGLLNAVLAVLAPPVNTDESERYDEEILDLPISGFIIVSVSLHLLRRNLIYPILLAGPTWTFQIER